MGSSGVKTNALAQFGQNSNAASSALQQVSPVYGQMLTGTDGYTPTQSADMNTAAMQGNGGGQAAAVGAGNLLAARDNNIGGLGSSISTAAQGAGDRNSAAALQVQNQSTNLADQRQQQALQGLSGIYSSSDAQANADLNTANNAQQPFWKQALLSGIKGAAQGATMGA